jgi:CBS domain containing-hemolysin-like protein
MGSVFTLFFVVLGVSFLCSLLESVFLSITQTHVAWAKKEGKAYSRLLDHLKDKVNRPLAAILTANTIVNTVGSAAIATQVYQLYGSLGVSIASGLLTVAILILAEIFPKILGAHYWKNMTGFAVYAIQVFIFILYPVVWTIERMAHPFGREDGNSVTREEVIAAAELGVEDGSIRQKESTIIKNLLTLNSLFVSDIMTPRSVFFALEENETVEEVFKKHRPIRFSRIPVYRESLDHVVGLTMRHRIHDALSSDQHHTKVGELTTPIQVVSERMTVAGLLEFLIKKKEHLALVLDDYGMVVGLVTLEDAIESLLGMEIVDELDSVTDMRQYAIEQWKSRKEQTRRS